jgi:DHA1 family bicyclomycin/chloramphenicol resistance-like MFS transporter
MIARRGVTRGSRHAGRSRAELAVVLGALTAFAPVSVDLYLPAFPSIAEHFGTSVGAVQLSLATYMVGLALGQVLYGRLSDIHGRRGPMLAGISLYVGASIACAFAPSVETLIGLRLLQGFGGCAGIVIARAIVRDLFAGAEAARFFSLLMLVFGVAPVVAPLLGGQILALAGWQAIFVALAAYGLVCLAMVMWLPETLPPERRRASGLPDALASYRQVLGNRQFVAYAAAGSLGTAALMAYLASSPAVIIDQLGVSPQAFGLIFGINSLGIVAVSHVTGHLVGRLGTERVLRYGIGAQAVPAVVLLVVTAAGGGGLAALLPLMFAVVASVGAILPTSSALAMTPFPDAAGAASAVFGTLQAGLAAVTAAIVSAIPLAPATGMGIVVAASSLLAGLSLLLIAPGHVEDSTAEAIG